MSLGLALDLVGPIVVVLAQNDVVHLTGHNLFSNGGSLYIQKNWKTETNEE